MKDIIFIFGDFMLVGLLMGALILLDKKKEKKNIPTIKNHATPDK